MTDTITAEPEIIEDLDTDFGEPGDHDKFAHIIKGANPIEAIALSQATRTPLVALCGKRWVPKKVEEGKFPICATCREILNDINFERIMSGGSEVKY